MVTPHTQVRCGTENFESGLQLLLDVCSLDSSFVGIYESHRRRLTRYREHCKSGLPTHLQTSSHCGSHCLQHLLGGQGRHSVECQHEHTEHCKDCDYGRLFIKSLRNMVSTLQTLGRLVGDALEDLQWRISDWENKHDKYVGHIIRGYHEINKKNEVFKNLRVGDVIEVSDWKMKFIMHLFRETMPDFFGKSGTAWAGTQFIVRVKTGSELTAFYYDGFTDDKKECSFSALSFLEVVQKHFYVELYGTLFPDFIDKPIFYDVFLDGAGCYVSLENLLTRIAFGERMHVYMRAMFIPEAYYNKTSLDGHFATAGKQMRASVSTGRADAFDAASMLLARTSDLAMGRGAINHAVHFQPNRDHQCRVKKISNLKVKSFSERSITWIPNTAANRSHVSLCHHKEMFTHVSLCHHKEMFTHVSLCHHKEMFTHVSLSHHIEIHMVTPHTQVPVVASRTRIRNRPTQRETIEGKTKWTSAVHHGVETHSCRPTQGNHNTLRGSIARDRPEKNVVPGSDVTSSFRYGYR